MEGGAIKGNESDIDGGGIYVEDTKATFTMKGGEISGNKALNPGSGKGGGVCAGAYGIFTMEGGTIKDNEAAIEGGGVYVAGTNSRFTMKGGDINGNKALNTSSGKGGGVCVGASGIFTMEGGTVSKNVSGNDGGGVYVEGANSKAYIRNGTIGGSSSTDANRAQYGAGVYARDAGYLELGTGGKSYSYPTIQNNASSNSSSGTGGGIVVYGAGAAAVFHHGTIRDNNGATRGGGILIGNGGKLDIQGGTITGNIAGVGPGLTVESGGSLSMSSLARVNDDNNPIYLHVTGLTITIAGDFSPLPISGDIAKIKTVAGYNSGDTILTGSSGHVQNYHDKFKVWTGGSYQSLSSGGQIP
jgi:hypothetical protein